MSTSAPAAENVILTEEDLRKSLAALAGTTVPEAEKKTVVETVALHKSAADALAEMSAESRAALEISPLLKDIAATLGRHVDRSLESLAKSLNGAAERDLGVIEVLTKLSKSLDANTAALEALKAQPAAPATAAGSTVTGTEVLHKNADGAPAAQPVDGKALRKQVLTGLETMAKSLPPGTQDQVRAQTALIRYESTGQINDADLAAALRQNKAA